MTHHIAWDETHIGHNVCDGNGEKIGSVTAVRQLSRAMGGQQPEGYVQCDCCLPQFSKNLYIPFSAFTECDGKCCYVDATKEEVSRKGWDRKPSAL